MTPAKAIAMAQAWTKDIEDEAVDNDFPLWHMVKTLLDHIRQQDKDIQELTLACQVLLRENKRKNDGLPRS